MKINKYVFLLFIILFSLKGITKQEDKTNKILSKELENLLESNSDNDYPELYDIEPIEHYNKNNIEETVRRHENNIILEKLKRKEEIKKFLYQNYKIN